MKLTGWPSGFSFDLDSMSRADLETIRDGFVEGRIAWETVGGDASGAGTRSRKRKARSDKGKKRAAYKKRAVFGEITNRAGDPLESDSSSDSDSDSSSSDSSSSGLSSSDDSESGDEAPQN